MLWLRDLPQWRFISWLCSSSIQVSCDSLSKIQAHGVPCLSNTDDLVPEGTRKCQAPTYQFSLTDEWQCLSLLFTFHWLVHIMWPNCLIESWDTHHPTGRGNKYRWSIVPNCCDLFSSNERMGLLTVIYSNHLFNNTRDDSTHGHHQRVPTEIRLITFLAAKVGDGLYSQQKQDQKLTVAQIMNSLSPNSDLNWRQ